MMVASIYFEKWLQLKKNRLAPTTWASYRAIMDRHLIPYFGADDLTEISPLEIEVFLNVLLETYSPNTVKRVYSVLRASLTKAVRLGLLDSNPAGTERIDPLPRVKKEIEVYSLDDLRQIITALEREPLRWEAFGRVAIDSGARRGELVALQWRDVEDNKMVIRRAAYKLPRLTAATKPPKSGQTRAVHLTQESTKLLSRLKREQRKECLRKGVSWSKQSFVFGNHGTMLHPTTPTRWWSMFLKRNELPHRGLHSLRHTSASLLLSAGVDIKTVSARLGHSSIEVTEIYLHLMQDSDQAAAQVLQNIL